MIRFSIWLQRLDGPINEKNKNLSFSTFHLNSNRDKLDQKFSIDPRIAEFPRNRITEDRSTEVSATIRPRFRSFHEARERRRSRNEKASLRDFPRRGVHTRRTRDGRG